MSRLIFYNFQIKYLQSAVRMIALSLSVLLLPACSDEEALEDLHKFVLSESFNDRPMIDPLPSIKHSEPFQYTASKMVNPFSEDNVIPRAPVLSQNDSVQPDQDRIRQALEHFPLDALKMVGSIVQNKQIHGLVLTPDHIIHHVTNGNYLGTQLGKIIGVTDRVIVLEETIKIENGRWEKRKVSLALTE